jgi:hypothetical protein
MNIKKQLKRHVGKKATRRIYKAIPWVGGAIALAVGSSIASRGVQRTADDLRELAGSVGRRDDT